MDASKLLKNLRDALWQASIELKRLSKEQPLDSYEVPLDAVARDLATHDVLDMTELKTVVDFLNRFDEQEDPSVDDVPDSTGNEIARITAELRSIRKHDDRDLGGFGKR